MKKLFIIAALLMATNSAQAGNAVSFQIEGQRIRIEAPRGCDSLSCLKITAPGLSTSSFKGLKSKMFDDEDDVASDPAPSKAAPAPVQAAAPQQAAPVAATAAPVAAAAPVETANAAPAEVAAPVPAPAPVAAPQPAPVAAAPDLTTPIGLWATEENKGNVRIEQCGANLCGYAEKSGEKILINMKPQANKWVGRINDPDSGRKYDSTIAMKGTNTLKVQGCAFGGMFCGGQTWKRVS